MEPDWTAPTDAPANSACCQCEGPLGGNRLRCDPCVEATHKAIELAGGAAVTASMIRAAREGMER